MSNWRRTKLEETCSVGSGASQPTPSSHSITANALSGVPLWHVVLESHWGVLSNDQPII